MNVQEHKNKSTVKRMWFIQNTTKQRGVQSLKPGFYDLTLVWIRRRLRVTSWNRASHFHFPLPGAQCSQMDCYHQDQFDAVVLVTETTRSDFIDGLPSARDKWSIQLLFWRAKSHLWSRAGAEGGERGFIWGYVEAWISASQLDGNQAQGCLEPKGGQE